MTLARIALVLGLINFVAVLFVAYKQYSSPTIVYVDSNHLINNYKEMQDARKTFPQKTVKEQRENIELTADVTNQINICIKISGAERLYYCVGATT